MDKIGERLGTLMGDMSDAQFARLCGIADSSIRQYLDGVSKPSLKNLVAIGRATGTSLDWLATGEGQKSSSGSDEEVRVPRLAFKAAAGSGALVIEDIGSSLAFPTELLTRRGIRHQSARALIAMGTSMMPTINDGDLMLVDISLRELVEGQIFAFTVGDEAFVKRLRRAPGRITMVSDNKDYPPETIPKGEDFRIIGQVRWAERVL